MVPVHSEGDEIEDIGTLKQLLARVFFTAETLEELKEKINKIQDTLSVVDENGDEMIISSFDIREMEE